MLSSNIKLWFSTLSFLMLITFSTALKMATCTCPKREHCHYNGPDSKETSDSKSKEVIVVTNGTSDYKAWNWDTLTTVITSGKENTEIMCHAHSLGKRYGVIIDLPVVKNLTVTNSEVIEWIEYLKKNKQNADIVVLNFMPFIMESQDEDIAKLVALLPDVKELINQPQTMDCIVPWKPIVISDEEEDTFTRNISGWCDRFMLSPDSYMHIDGYSCKARATIPITKLALGVDEYVTEGITEDRLIIGVPWHGYNYPCQSYNKTTMVCKLKKVNGICDIMNRKKVTVADMLSRPEINLLHANKWNEAYKAPFHVFFENTSAGESYHQLWYEDVESLRVKYTFVKDLQLKGLAVYTAEDLTSSSTMSSIIDFDSAMWSWILHDLLNRGKVKPRGTAKYYYASTVTGVGIGCLFGGVLLGVIFTCIAFRKIEKKKLPPFRKDMVQDDYHDDIDL